MRTSEKAKAIRLLILDVDGVLTSGSLFYANNTDEVVEIKGFHVHDGLGMKLLQRAGIEIAIISAKHSKAVTKRLQDLQIKHVYLGHENKIPVYETLKQTLNLEDNHIAYMGDDLPDLPLLKRAGFSITVPQSSDLIKKHSDYITEHKAGKGAVREICELILHAQDRYEAVIQSYLLA